MMSVMFFERSWHELSYPAHHLIRGCDHWGDEDEWMEIILQQPEDLWPDVLHQAWRSDFPEEEQQLLKEMGNHLPDREGFERLAYAEFELDCIEDYLHMKLEKNIEFLQKEGSDFISRFVKEPYPPGNWTYFDGFESAKKYAQQDIQGILDFRENRKKWS